MTAVLQKFRVKHFRSINDSNWIDTNELTALIGTNEAGKTNLLLPLWKLNPANKELIDPLLDYPRINYSDFKADGDDEPFISAVFLLNHEQQQKLADSLKISQVHLKTIRYSRYWNGSYTAHLTDLEDSTFDAKLFSNFFAARIKSIEPIGDFKGHEAVKNLIYKVIEDCKSWEMHLIQTNIENDFLKCLSKLEYELEEIQESAFKNVLSDIDKIVNIIALKGALDGEALKMSLKFLPNFVYYSDYGNLNSEIYLPRVIEDLDRSDLRGIERDKARTLRVLFQFVKLTPAEILDLGREQVDNQNKTNDTIAGEAKRKKEREVLLQSASSSMTREFKDWWKQGNYKFRFQADGNHFRIWVSDEKRPEEIELESRSRGLQWFFSFFLVFLVESQGEHAGCILLLDEPGVTLHPAAQEDLIVFFKALSESNQVLYTTHSPFLIDSSNLGDVKAVYVDEKGLSVVSNDLRKGSKVAEKSVYPAHAAIGLTVSETFLNGCQPVLVEGVSDQIYLHAIKTYLVKRGLIKPEKEIVFIPTGGIKGMKPIINIITGKENSFPVVILDSDEAGLKMSADLKSNLFKTAADKIIDIAAYIECTNSEIEDIIPQNLLAESFDKLFHDPDFALVDAIDETVTFVTQAEGFMQEQERTLDAGWKVELAKDVVKKLYKLDVDNGVEKKWTELFTRILALPTENQDKGKGNKKNVDKKVAK